MADTLFADVSEYQTFVNDAYPYHFISIRSNDGTYRDWRFARNYAWCKKAADAGDIAGFIVYCVYRPNWRDVLNNLKAQVGPNPHPKMVVMIDVESWGGQIGGNQSAGINALREAVIKWLGGNRARVIGYGNQGDLNNLWRTKGDAKLVVASYGSNPSYPHKIAHQYTDRGACAPFGHCDMNSADGFSPSQFAAALGLVKAAPPKPVPVPSKPVPVPSKPVPPAPHQPVPVPPKPPVHQDRQYVVRSGDTLSEIGVKFSVDWRLIAKRNRITNANRLKVGQRLYIDRTAPVVKHAAPTTYKVVSGDTLSGIASKVNKKYGYKLTWQKLAKLNHISNANHIKVGQVLKLK